MGVAVGLGPLVAGHIKAPDAEEDEVGAGTEGGWVGKVGQGLQDEELREVEA